jgi:hypothetical protein
LVLCHHVSEHTHLLLIQVFVQHPHDWLSRLFSFQVIYDEYEHLVFFHPVTGKMINSLIPCSLLIDLFWRTQEFIPLLRSLPCVIIEFKHIERIVNGIQRCVSLNPLSNSEKPCKYQQYVHFLGFEGEFGRDLAHQFLLHFPEHLKCQPQLLLLIDIRWLFFITFRITNPF